MRRLWQAPDAPAVSAVIISSPANINYLCGFEGSSGILVVSPGDCWLLLDGRYEQGARTAQAAGNLAEMHIQKVPGRFDRALAELMSSLPPGPVGFEAESVTVATLEAWQQASADRLFVASRQWVEKLRSVKDPFEIGIVRRACAATAAVGRELRRWVSAGRSEREVAADIDAALVRAGCSRTAFQTIAASGPNSALPHARPTDRLLREGDLVVLDFGGVLGGYCGDLTRVAGVGRIRADARALFDAVRAAQVAALAAVRAQALTFEVDAAARGVLASHGFGDAFVHATGHGLGLEVHEAPRLARAEDGSSTEVRLQAPEVRLQAGMVCTIEPGAYVEGLGGARLEDDVLVTVDGCEVLTDVPRDLLTV
jgi:Xaa-Pro aminopeptidase